MAAQVDPLPPGPPPGDYHRISFLWKKIFGKNNTSNTDPTTCDPLQVDSKEATPQEGSTNGGILRRASRRVVPGLPRAKTFKRQQSEDREKLEPVKPSPEERRAQSVDRRGPSSLHHDHHQQFPRASAPDFLDSYSVTTVDNNFSVPESPIEEKTQLNMPDVPSINLQDQPGETLQSAPPLPPPRAPSTADDRSITTSEYDTQIHDELENKWILNLSMHFRDKSKREKFFVTYRETDSVWRRVTISLDYRNAPEGSLENELARTKFQREKSAKIYEDIRESLQDIQFYSTVTNLKLQTTDGRLHVHVMEDVNEIIHYPTVQMVQHLGCQLVCEKDLEFDSHMSGFVYKVRVNGHILIKKEIPGPDTVDEFLYEVNALNSLVKSRNVISFYGVVVDNDRQHVKGLLIEYAERGALIDVIYDSQEHDLDLPWSVREKWARQIVQGLSDIHEAGFVQGDFTLSNIVIDANNNAKIIDINRRGCPVGWEPPEATPLINSNQRISMYIGVKSDLYQLGMVLWALATLEDEPEAHRRPLRLDPDIVLPQYFRTMVGICLSEDPRMRLHTTALLTMFPERVYIGQYDDSLHQSISVDDGISIQRYTVDNFDHNGRPIIRTVTPQSDWYVSGRGRQSGINSPGQSDDAYPYPPRGRSPPSPLPSNPGECERPYLPNDVSWSRDISERPSLSDVAPDDDRSVTPKDSKPENGPSLNADDHAGSYRHKEDFRQNPSPKENLAAPGQTPAIYENVLGLTEEDADTPTGRSEDAFSAILDDSTPTGPLNNFDGLVAAEITIPSSETLQEQSEQVRSALAPEAKDTAFVKDDVPRELPVPQQFDVSNHVINEETFRLLDSKDSTDPSTISTADEVALPHVHAPNGLKGNVMNDLTGIGDAYNTQDDIRQPACIDEDLELMIANTSTAPQNIG